MEIYVYTLSIRRAHNSREINEAEKSGGGYWGGGGARRKARNQKSLKISIFSFSLDYIWDGSIE